MKCDHLSLSLYCGRWWPSLNASNPVLRSAGMRIFTCRAVERWAPPHPLSCAVPNTHHKQPAPPPTPWTHPPLNTILCVERPLSDHPPNPDKDSSQPCEGIPGRLFYSHAVQCSRFLYHIDVFLSYDVNRYPGIVRSIICATWCSAGNLKWSHISLCPVRPCQDISRNGSKLWLSLPMSGVASFSHQKKLQNVLPQGSFSFFLKTHFLKSNTLVMKQSWWPGDMMVTVLFPVCYLKKGKKTFVSDCELDRLWIGHY